MKVITWQGRVWRAEEHRDGWRLFQHGGQRLSRATLDEVVALLLAEGVDPEKDLDG